MGQEIQRPGAAAYQVDMLAVGFCDFLHHAAGGNIFGVLGTEDPVGLVLDEQPEKFAKVINIEHGTLIGNVRKNRQLFRQPG